MTSSQHPALWLACSFISSVSASIPIVVNTHDTFQTIDGFGACIVSYDLMPAYQDPEFYDRAVFDMGMSILRLPIVGFETFSNDNSDPEDFDWQAAGYEEMSYVMDIARQFQARGIGHIIGTPWSPPGWMKTNRSSILGGRLRPDMREEFAEYLRAYIQGAETHFGVQIDSVSLQNELLFVEPYESCVYNPLQLRETLRVIQQHFMRNNLSNELVLSEEMGWADRFILYLEPLMADAETRDFNGFFASHGGNGFDNWQKMAANLAPFEKRLWMTETSGYQPTWDGALALAENIHDTLAGGNASAFIYWQYSEPVPGRMALMASGQYTPKAYAVKHFARFVRPGSERIYAGGANDGLMVSAYQHSVSRDLTVVLINSANEPATVNLQFAGPDAPLNWLTFTSRDGHYLLPGQASVKDALDIPARGMVTVYGRSGESIPELPSLVPEGWQPPPLGETLHRDSANSPDQRLHAAARHKDLDGIRQLLAEGLDPNALNVGKLTPLHRAAWPGHVEVVQPLLEGGAEPNAPDGTGGSAIFIAAGNGHDDFIKALVAAGADVNHSDRQGQTALHRAALGGQLSTVRTLLELGADPNLSSKHGWAALHWAASTPEREAVTILQLLLEAGANPDTPDKEGKTPLHIAAANAVDLGMFHRRGNAATALYFNANRMRVLVETGADVNARDANGRTPLHWLAWMGETLHGEDVAGRPWFQYLTEGVRYLLAAGANPAPLDNFGRSPADYAKNEGYFETVVLLENAATLPWLVGGLSSSASIKPIDAKTTPLEEITSSPAPETTALTRRLYDAALHGRIDEVQTLLADGANPNSASPRIGNPLHAAVIGSHLSIVKVLLEAGADPLRRDSDGYHALDRALQNNQTDIANALEAALHAKN